MKKLAFILCSFFVMTDSIAQCDSKHCSHLSIEESLALAGIVLPKIKHKQSPVLRSSGTTVQTPSRVEFILANEIPELLGMTETEIEENILHLGNFFQTCHDLANFDHPGVEVANLHILPPGQYQTEKNAGGMISYTSFDDTFMPDFGDPAFFGSRERADRLDLSLKVIVAPDDYTVRLNGTELAIGGVRGFAQAMSPTNKNAYFSNFVISKSIFEEILSREEKGIDVMLHEIGHLWFRGNHCPGIVIGNNPIAYCFESSLGKTLMGTGDKYYRTYSNPNVTIGGITIGSATQNSFLAYQQSLDGSDGTLGVNDFHDELFVKIDPEKLTSSTAMTQIDFCSRGTISVIVDGVHVNPVSVSNDAVQLQLANGTYDIVITSSDVDHDYSKSDTICVTVDIPVIDNDGDGYPADQDCDDNNATINPGATEICDGLDNNCNGQVDEGLTTFTYYQDLDGDLYGSTVTLVGCSQPAGYVHISGDCDDNNAAINPGATEVCDGLDNNCNGSIDEGVAPSTYYQDSDGDGFGSTVSITDCTQPAGYVTNSTDCNDGDPTIYPGATEQCNGLDNNCNGLIDDGVTTATYYQDNDGDGYGSTVSIIDCTQPAGFVSNADDCNDGDAMIFPGATEVCDAIDNNCDGQVDEGVLITLYLDADNDGYGTENTSVSDCSTDLPGYSTQFGDCDDADATVYPGAPEVCDDQDNNCDGAIDEGLTLITYFQDNDGDGFGDLTSALESCNMMLTGFVSNGDDCDDNNPDVNPDAIELLDNNIDDDCDGEVDEFSDSVVDLNGVLIKMYPNPAYDQITLSGLSNKETLEIYSIEGRLVLRTQTSTTANTILDISPLAGGVYVVKANGSFAGKFNVIR